MLFGEYGVLYGGEGLAIPCNRYHAWWSKSAEDVEYQLPVSLLEQMAAFCADHTLISEHLDIGSWVEVMHSGETIATDIPIGYGLGSSGSVVAAVYDRFHIKEVQDIKQLREILARMEDFFHQKSSGLDPLVCYLDQAVRLHGEEVELVDAPVTLHFELFDTEINRSTHHLVEIFRERMKDEEYSHFILDIYLPLNRSCIDAWLSNDCETLLSKLKKLSSLQLEYFNFAIPTHVWYDWGQDLAHGNHIMKLCGAGGGGYMLRFDTAGI